MHKLMAIDVMYIQWLNTSITFAYVCVFYWGAFRHLFTECGGNYKRMIIQSTLFATNKSGGIFQVPLDFLLV